MSTIAVMATLGFDPAERDLMISELLAHRRRCLDTEPGTLVFEPMLSRDEPGRIYLYEVYRDQDAFQAHWDGASLAELNRATGGRLVILSGTWGLPLAND